MGLHLQNKLALVTGSTSIIGKAVAAGLVRERTSVIINSRSEERVKATIQELKEFGNVYGIKTALTQPVGQCRNWLDAHKH